MPPQQPSNETASKSYIYIYEIVQLEPPPNINVFFGFVNTYEKYLGTERLDRVSKKNLIV